MKVLIIGGGGREEAMAKKLAEDARITELFVAPGNGGTDGMRHTSGTAHNVAIGADDILGLVTFAGERGIDFTIVGTEEALAQGIVNAFRMRSRNIFGPAMAAARIESSKVFAKQLMRRAGIPTASYQSYANCRDAGMDLTTTFPCVVKESGLAQGKGSYICRTPEDMESALNAIARRTHGKDATVIIEEYLAGEELSVHVLCDGKTPLTLPAVRDYKALYLNPDGTEGPNTGGMGAYSPVADATLELMERVMEVVVNPALNGLAIEGGSFRGCLYPGLKILPDGGIKVLEFNARFGDPETQVILRRLETPLLDLLMATTDGTLHLQNPIWDPSPCYCLVIAAKGYPGEYKKGMKIGGLIEAEQAARGIKIYHAGTVKEDNVFYTLGGRVLNITGLNKEGVYAAAKCITFDGSREEVYYRKDLFCSP